MSDYVVVKIPLKNAIERAIFTANNMKRALDAGLPLTWHQLESTIADAYLAMAQVRNRFEEQE